MPRAVVDTNVWVSALLTPAGPPARVRAALGAHRFTLVASEPLLAELAEVLKRPRIVRKYGITPAEVSEIIDLIRTRADLVPVSGTVRVCRDPDDDVVVETALRGRADALVTRDEALKGDAEVTAVLGAAGISVVSVQRFLDALDSPT